MSIRPRGNTFQVDICVGSQRIRKDGFASHSQAEAWETQAKAKLAKGESVDERPVVGEHVTTLEQLLHNTTMRFWRGTRGESTTVKNAQDCVDYFGPKTHPRKVTSSSVDGLVAHLTSKGLSNATINRKLAALSKMLKVAAIRGWIEVKPIIEKRKESQHRLRWYDAREEALIVGFYQKTGKPMMGDFVEFLIDTGLRLSEALRLEFKDAVDGWVRVWNNKADKPRSVPMTVRVKRLVEKQRKLAPEGEGRVWFDLDLHRCEYCWRDMRTKLNMDHDEQFVIHACRHTFGSRLVQAGVSLQVVQELMGHKTITVTQRYAHLAAANLVSAIAALSIGQNPISLADTSHVTSRDAVTPIAEVTAKIA